MDSVVSRGRSLLLPFVLLPALAFAQGTAGALHIAAVDAARPGHLEFVLDLPEETQAKDHGEFQLLEDGRATQQARSARSFRNSGWALATVLAVDTSRSVQKYLRAMRTALPGFVAQHPPADAFALVTFDDAVNPRVPFGAPRDQVRATLTGLNPSGQKTLLYSALQRSIKSFEAVPSGRTWRRIIVMSDGADESSDRPDATDAIIKEALGAGVVIDTIWVGRPVASTRNTLVRLAERTGGVHSDCSDPEKDMGERLARSTTRVDKSIVVAFDRKVQPGTATDQVGVRLARAGIAPALLAMQVLRSAPTETPPPDGWPWLWILTLVILALVVSYFVYAAVSTFVFKRPIFPWKEEEEEEISSIVDHMAPTPRPAPRRHTRVGDPAPVMNPEGPSRTLLLEGVEGPMKGESIPIARPRFQIGASKGNDLQIGSDKYLSGVHAVIQLSRNGWIVLDQQSANGTYVDGRKVGSGGHELRDGQRLRIGGSQFNVVLGAAGLAEPTAEAGPR